MPELLFEIGTEELPSPYVSRAKEALYRLTTEALSEARLSYDKVHTYATPRRIAVRVEGLSGRSEARTETRRGPAVSVAFDASGGPTRAAQGFARANGVAPEDLVTEETEKGAYVFARVRQGGETAQQILPPLLAGLVERFPAPRKMRWADVEVPFVRPIAWVVALLDDELLPVEVAGLRAGRVSRGHRFLGEGEVNVPNPSDYLETLRDAFVIADLSERRTRTWEEARSAAAAEGLTPIENDALLDEVTNLVESPVGVLGEFAPSYLDLPEEVLITIMIHHQRFFPTRDAEGRLAPYFVSVSNNRVPEPRVVRRGYEGVLEGRLYDARFFWDADRRKSLSQHAWGLSGIGFQKDLGTMADKVARVAEGANRLANRLTLGEEELDTLERTIPLFRADLSTQMVFELPELAGVMARAYALAEGLPERVAEALEHAVKPSGPDAPLPTSRVGALLAAADRSDTLLGFFALQKRPTGSADPFGLRRDGIALARILNAQGWPLQVGDIVKAAAQSYNGKVRPDEAVQEEVVGFVWDRVGSLLVEEGVRTELVRAATADNPPVITAARRAHLLSALSREEEFGELLTLYKRAANLAKDASENTPIDPDLFSEPQEGALFESLLPAKRAVGELMSVARRTLLPWDLGRGPAERLGNLDEEIREILALKAPLDAFLDGVLVKVEDEAVRENRLALLRETQGALRALGALEALEGMGGA